MKQQIIRGLFFAGGVALCVAAYAALEIVSGGKSLSGLLPVVASFGCFGLLLGAIYAFDANEDLKGVSRPIPRVATSAIAGLALALLWRWPIEGALLSVLVAALLGYLGLVWARM